MVCRAGDPGAGRGGPAAGDEDYIYIYIYIYIYAGLEILVLDEADRLLEMGFTEEVEELVKMCPVTRQALI